MTTFGRALPQIKEPLGGERTAAFVYRLAQVECPSFTARRARRQERTGASFDPIVWSRAAGTNVEDVDGNVFVDLTAGFGVAALGYGHPRIVRAINQQLKRLPQALGDLHPSDTKVQLLERLAELAPFPEAKVALALSGADALEIAMKTAVLATGRAGIVAFQGGYHGLSHGPLAACGFAEAFRAPFLEQLNPRVAFVPFPSSKTSTEVAMSRLQACWPKWTPGAVVVEPIQARGGVRVPPAGFLAALSRWCVEQGVLVIADEVYTGLGRTGHWFASAAHGLDADLICLGKALGGGLPVSACIGKGSVMNAWRGAAQGALHTGTLFGHPPGCAAALTVLDLLTEDDLMARVQQLGEALMAQLGALVEHGLLRQVRGEGLLVGFELQKHADTDQGASCLAFVRALMERGYLVLPGGTEGDIVQLSPALTVQPEILSAFVTTVKSVLTEGPPPT